MTVGHSTLPALKSHFYRKHYHSCDDDISDTAIIQEEIVHDSTDNFDDQLKFFSNNDETIEADISCLLGLDESKQKRDSALFLMRMKEVRKLSQVTIDDIVTNCQSLFENTVNHLHAGVRQKLSATEVDNSFVHEVFEKMKNPFEGLETKYLQEKYITKEFQVLVRIQIYNVLLYNIILYS